MTSAVRPNFRASQNMAGLIGAEETLTQREVLINFTPFSVFALRVPIAAGDQHGDIVPTRCARFRQHAHMILDAAHNGKIVFVDVEDVHGQCLSLRRRYTRNTPYCSCV